MTQPNDSHDDRSHDDDAESHDAGPVPVPRHAQLTTTARFLAALAIVVCLGTWGVQMARSNGAVVYSYVTMFLWTWIVPVILVIAAWIFFACGSRRNPDKRSKTATSTLLLLVPQTILLTLVGVIVGLVIAALKSDFG